jgi:hypothetical protein
MTRSEATQYAAAYLGLIAMTSAVAFWIFFG